MDYEEADDVPNCECGRVMRVQTAAGVWKCWWCDPEAKSRYKRTQRLLELSEAMKPSRREQAGNG